MQAHSHISIFAVTTAFFLSVITTVSLSADQNERNQRPASSIVSQTTYRTFLINNVFAYFANNGDGLYNPFSENHEGFEFYKGQGKHIFYEEGLLWGGYHGGRAIPKVGGSSYRHALQPGPIVTSGTVSSPPIGASDTTGDRYRIYRVRPDIGPLISFASVQATLQAEETAYLSRYEAVTSEEIFNQYIKDWNEWPASLGAPFAYGKDSLGIQRTGGPYNPRFDIPGMPDAQQTLWYVANDLDSTLTSSLAGCPPIGLEVQHTIWGYTRNMGALTSTIFERTLLINRSGSPVDSMYFAQFSDPDLGNAGDDYVGCDTTRDLGYVYNSKSPDYGFGTSIPAAGFVLLQGPCVPSTGSVAAFGLGRRNDRKNLPMTSFMGFSNALVGWNVPTSGTNGDVQWYNFMKGLTKFGTPMIDPNTNRRIRFYCPGEPQTAGTGWVDGMFGLSVSDRQMALCSGPFTLANGDTQEVVVACVAGLGFDRLQSVSVLRNYATKLKEFWNDLTGIGTTTGFSHQPGIIPTSYALYQNYPNPFNPTTTIRFTIAGVVALSGREGPATKVRLAVYDLLGRLVAVLVDEDKKPGSYQVLFSGAGLSSGIYVYRLTAGEYSTSRKMLLVG
jgi:hypothetical protein